MDRSLPHASAGNRRSPQSVFSYVHDLRGYLSTGWNAFWFGGRTDDEMVLLRRVIGCLALLWQLSFTADLIRWFGPAGWLDAGVYYRWVTEDMSGWSGRLSLLFTSTPALLWALHAASSAILIAFVVGYQLRWTRILAWVVILSYVHRAPFLGDKSAHVLTMVLGYLAFASTPVARRLIQVHLAILYAAMFTTKLIAPVWWNGEALWWMNAQTLGVNHHLLFFRAQPMVLNTWTFAVLLTELAMFTLVWNRQLRPLVVACSIVSWLSLALVTGHVGVSMVMIAAGLAFCGTSVAEEQDVLRETNR